MQQDFLKELAELKIVKVAGSYARGEATTLSDIDFQIKASKQDDMYNEPNRNVVTIKKLLAKYNYKWESTRNGYMSTNSIPRNENNDLLIHMEFYEYFYRNKNKLPKVEILCVEFDTW